VLIRQTDICRDGVRVLLHGERLACQHGLVDLQRDGRGDTKVGGDPVARRKLNEVAGYDLGYGDEARRPGADDPSHRRLHGAEGLQRPRRLPFHRETDERVQGNDREDGHSVEPLSQPQPGDGRRNDQQDHHRLNQLPRQPCPPRRWG